LASKGIKTTDVVRIKNELNSLPIMSRNLAMEYLNNNVRADGISRDCERELNWKDRDEIQQILEDYGFAVYESESTDEIRSALWDNINDGTIPESVLYASGLRENSYKDFNPSAKSGIDRFVKLNTTEQKYYGMVYENQTGKIYTHLGNKEDFYSWLDKKLGD